MLQSMGLQHVGHDWVTEQQILLIQSYIPPNTDYYRNIFWRNVLKIKVSHTNILVPPPKLKHSLASSLSRKDITVGAEANTLRLPKKHKRTGKTQSTFKELLNMRETDMKEKYFSKNWDNVLNWRKAQIIYTITTDIKCCFHFKKLHK